MFSLFHCYFAHNPPLSSLNQPISSQYWLIKGEKARQRYELIRLKPNILTIKLRLSDFSVLFTPLLALINFFFAISLHLTKLTLQRQAFPQQHCINWRIFTKSSTQRFKLLHIEPLSHNTATQIGKCIIHPLLETTA